MPKIRNISPKSFSNIKYFPGTAGNPFDKFLHSLEGIDRLSSFTFAVILLFLSLLGNHFQPLQSGVLYLFFVLDWILIALLPALKLSYGPVKPVVLTLALLRTLFALLPAGWNFAAELIGTFLVFYGFYYEPFHLDIHHETYKTSKLTPGQHLCVAHLGDLHMERLTKRDRAILLALKELHPDLILFS